MPAHQRARLAAAVELGGQIGRFAAVGRRRRHLVHRRRRRVRRAVHDVDDDRHRDLGRGDGVRRAAASTSSGPRRRGDGVRRVGDATTGSGGRCSSRAAGSSAASASAASPGAGETVPGMELRPTTIGGQFLTGESTRACRSQTNKPPRCGRAAVRAPPPVLAQFRLVPQDERPPVADLKGMARRRRPLAAAARQSASHGRATPPRATRSPTSRSGTRTSRARDVHLFELHQLFLDMSVLVEAQGELLDQIEYTVGAVGQLLRQGGRARCAPRQVRSAGCGRSGAGTLRSCCASLRRGEHGAISRPFFRRHTPGRAATTCASVLRRVAPHPACDVASAPAASAIPAAHPHPAPCFATTPQSSLVGSRSGFSAVSPQLPRTTDSPRSRTPRAGASSRPWETAGMPKGVAHLAARRCRDNGGRWFGGISGGKLPMSEEPNSRETFPRHVPRASLLRGMRHPIL